MAKMKVYEIAKELDKHSKDIINYLTEHGVDVKSHMSNLEDSSVSMVKKHFAPQAKPVSHTANNVVAGSVAPNQTRPTGNVSQTNSSAQQNRRPGNFNSAGGNSDSNRQNYSSQNNRPAGQNTSANQNMRPNSRFQNDQQGQRPTGQSGQFRSNDNRQGQNQSQGYNQQRYGGQGQNRGNNQQGYSSQGQNRPYNQQGQNQQYGQNRPYNNEGRSNNYNNENRPNNYNNENRPNNYNNENRPNNYNNEGRPNNYNNENRPNNYNNEGRPNNHNNENRPNNYNNEGRPNNYNNNRPYNSNRPQGQNQGQGQTGGYNRSNNQSGQYRQGNQTSTDGQSRFPRSNQNNGAQGGRPYNNSNQQGRPNQSGGYNNQNRTGRPEGGGYQNRSYSNPNSGMFNKDEGEDNKRGNFRSASKTTKPKSLDAPIGMSRSDAVNNRNSRVNKNVKNNYNRKDIDKDIMEEEIKKPKKGQFIMPKPAPVQDAKDDEVKTIVIPEILTMKELAEKMKMTPSTLVKKLFLAGKMVSINSEITFEEAEEIAIEYEIIAELEQKVDVIEELLKEDEEDPTKLEKRPPVVCVMGHVDHGKTSLLDAIRETHVTSHEAGGITQHIGAYVVDINNEKITFLDTPGHEAFTSMRMRGAQSTDIAILVVAADDGVMPQTVEAISHAKAAGIQIIVAINKIDKPSANIERVKQELTEHELVAEDWGGDTVFVPVSAHTKDGIDQLLEMILLTAEMLELKANPNRNARGIVIEAELDKGRGPVATILVQKGTLHVGDSIAIGSAYGKVRAMMDDQGRRVDEATPSTPVEILGLHDVPDAGEIFMATDNEKEARAISEAYVSQGREKLLADTKAKLSLDGLFSQIKAGNIKELNIIVKADVQGSVEAVKQSLLKLSNEEVAVRIIHGGVGAINESDVTLASASNAIIIGFNVRPDNTAKDTADREKVDVRLYRVIYNAIEDVEAAMKGMLDPTFEEKVIGHAEIRQIFKASGLGTIAGSYVLDGKITRGCSSRVLRDGVVVFDGALASIKRFKDDVKEVASGYECGLVFEKYNDVKEFDQVELYIMQEIPRK
ncbi:MAG: translation initiation factor [Anaerocolumna sp.]|jgi:translation initiation factor IF-2|nr:translation initiation factor [Anaerocolumna sp.]